MSLHVSKIAGHRKILDLFLRSWMKVAGGAGYTPRHCQPYHGISARQPADDHKILRGCSRAAHRVMQAHDRLNNHWIGDLIGAAGLFVLLVAGLVMGA